MANMHLRPSMARVNPGNFQGTVCGEQGPMTDDASLVDCAMCKHWNALATMDEFTDGYVTCALWSSNDNANDSGGAPLDSNYSAADIAPETFAAMLADCAKFQKENESGIAAAIENGGNDSLAYSNARAGHDFWLTRNGHGAGFWDRGLGDNGDNLSKASKAFGDCDLYVGDDGKIYC